MTAMRGATAGFKTGDIVICYYPERPKQFLHLTVFLQAAHSPTRSPAFVHAESPSSPPRTRSPGFRGAPANPT